MIGLGPDTAGIGDSLTAAVGRAARDPGLMFKAVATLTGGLSAIPSTVLTDWVNAPKQAKDSKQTDRRFSDPHGPRTPTSTRCCWPICPGATSHEPWFRNRAWTTRRAAKAKLGVELMLDAVAPSNFLFTNPTAIKRAFDTAGVSLLKGARNFTVDLFQNRGMPRQVDSSPFELGRNIAVTPSKVVFRNELMELLQYEPQTDTVHETPLLCSPPWINKYYIMDLAPQRSFIEWAVQHGRTVFAISYRNPTAEMARTTMDDYLISGPQQALDVVSEITGASKVDMVGLCLGGALTAITAAYLNQTGDDRIGSLTLLNTMLDYSEPGQLGVFTDEASIDRLEKEMAKSGGTLPGKSMAGMFDVLRANDLIFSYVVSNWLLGQTPPAFDILAWNNDSTQMPAAMHTFYLRNFYVKICAKGELQIEGANDRPERGQVEHLHSQREERSCRGSRRTRAPDCCPAPPGSCSATAGTSRESSTRRGPRHGSSPMTTTPPAPTTGCRAPSAPPSHGGSTGPHGPASKPVPWSSRPRSAAASTRCSATGPASTRSTDLPRLRRGGRSSPGPRAAWDGNRRVGARGSARSGDRVTGAEPVAVGNEGSDGKRIIQGELPG